MILDRENVRLSTSIPPMREDVLAAAKSKKTAIVGKSGLRSYYVNPAIVDIVTDPKHPLYCPRLMTPVDQEFVDQMDKHGNDQPVKITKVGGRYLCVWGRRRVIATRRANRQRELSLLPRSGPRLLLVGVDNSPLSVLQDQMIRENEARRPATPVEQAFAIQNYILSGRTRKEACETFGIPMGTLRNRIRITSLAPEVIEAVVAGRLKITKALEWYSLEPKAQVVSMWHYLAKTPKKRKKRAPHPLPKPPQVDALLGNSAAPPAVQLAIRWLRGDLSTKDFCAKVPQVSAALGQQTED